ncbi:hypothetical protein [Skermania piniformis]|uniref:Uncharacterized protein n=1 Tax=Skermania pinensis TaxID=39122 RepID=A0ABX8S5N1_9ACTN|nr:hypothetical protein [Skermania piniformis]QXQ13164.1 hypothetical protein KV203_14925 [Skermania piniformis]
MAVTDTTVIDPTLTEAVPLRSVGTATSPDTGAAEAIANQGIASTAAALDTPIEDIQTIGPADEDLAAPAPDAVDAAPAAGLLALAGLPLLGGGAAPTGVPPTPWLLMWWMRRTTDSDFDWFTDAATGAVTPQITNAAMLTTDTNGVGDQAPILVITPTATDPDSGGVTYRVDIGDFDGDDELPAVTVSDLVHGSITDHGDGTVTYTPTDAARYGAGAAGATDADKFEYVTATATDRNGLATTVQVTVPIAADDTLVISDNTVLNVQPSSSRDGSRLYLTHPSYSADEPTYNEVTVVDTDTGRSRILTVPGSPSSPIVESIDGTHAFVVSSVQAESGGDEYTSYLTTFDTATGAATSVEVGSGRANLLVISPTGDQGAFVRQIGEESVLTVFDTVTSTVTATASTPGRVGIASVDKPIVFTPDGGRIVYTTTDRSSTAISYLTTLDTTTGATTTVSQPGIAADLLLAADGAHAYLTSGDLSGPDYVTYLTALDTTTGTTTTANASGKPFDAVVGTDGTVYLATGPHNNAGVASFVAVDPTTGTATTIYSSASTPSHVLLSADGTRGYYTTTNTDGPTTTELHSVELTAGAADVELTAGAADSVLVTAGSPRSLVRGPDGNHVYLTTTRIGDPTGASVTDFIGIDTTTGARTIMVTTPGLPSRYSAGPVEPVFTPDGRTAVLTTLGYGASAGTYVSYSTTIDTSTGTAHTVELAGAPEGNSIAPDGSWALINTLDGNVFSSPVFDLTLLRLAHADDNQAPILVITPVSIDPDTGAVDYHVDIADPDGTGELPDVTVSELVHGSITDHGDGTVTYTPTEAARYAAGAVGATDADKFEYVTVTATDRGGAATVVQVVVPIAPLTATFQADSVAYDFPGTVDRTTYSADGTRAYLIDSTTDSTTGDTAVRLSIIDTTSGAVTATAALPGTVSSTIEGPDGGHLYLLSGTSDEDGSTTYFSSVDTATGTTTSTAVASFTDYQMSGTPTSDLSLSDDGSRAYYASSALDRSLVLYTIDTGTGTATSLVVPGTANPFSTPTGYSAPRVSDDGDTAYILTLYPASGRSDASSRLSVVDTATGASTSYYGNPSGVVQLTPDGEQAYFYTVSPYRGDSTAVLLITSDTRTATTVAPAATQGAELVVTADGRHAYYVADVPNPPSGSYPIQVTLIDTATGTARAVFTAADSVPITGPDSGTHLVLTPDGNRAYVVTATATAGAWTTVLTSIDTATGTPTDVLTTAGAPAKVWTAPDGTCAFLVTAIGSTTTLTTVDTATGAYTSVELPSDWRYPEFSPDGAYAYRVNGDTVQIFQTATGATTTVPTGPNPGYLQIAPDGRTALIRAQGSTGGVTVTLLQPSGADQPSATMLT